MDNDLQIKARLLAALFAIQAVLNWLYVLWVKAQPIINNAWFVVLPLIGFFYFAFAFIACVWIVTRKTIGINLAYCVLMFGSAVDVLSYSLIYNKDSFIEAMMLPLLITNFIVVFYIASKQKYFRNN